MIHDVTIGKFGAFYVNPGSKGNGLDENDSASLTPFNTRYHNDTPVMQFTGLKDKNGNDIYEGDLVKIIAADVFGVVEWMKELALFEIKILTPDYVDATMTLYSNQKEGNNTNREIIGNIYKNPELIPRAAGV